MANLGDLEKRILALEDIQAIRNLKATYAAYCDNGYPPDKLAPLFVEDAYWESEGIGTFQGRQAIREFFGRASKIFTFAIHYSMNPHIEVNGDTAKGRWFTLMPCTVSNDNRGLWLAGIDNEEYVKVDGQWMFKSKITKRIFRTPYEDGWAKTRFS